MISEDVQRRVDAYRGNPGALAKRYQMTQELLDLLALQKLKSEKEAAARSMALAMQQQGEPPTVAQQREQQVAQMSKQELAQQLGGAGAGGNSPMMSGVASAPGAENVMPERAMAAGGIVAFEGGGPISARIDEERMPNAPEYLPARQRSASILANMDDMQLIATATKLSGMPIETPTQARFVLQKMMGDKTFEAGVSGLGALIPQRVMGASFGASMPAMGGRLRAGIDVARGTSPALNIGYSREFARGGPIRFDRGGMPINEDSAQKAVRELDEMNRGERVSLSPDVEVFLAKQPRAGAQAYADRERQRMLASSRDIARGVGLAAPRAEQIDPFLTEPGYAASVTPPTIPREARTTDRPGTPYPEEETTESQVRPLATVASPAVETKQDGVAALLEKAKQPTARPAEIGLPSVVRTPEQMGALLSAGRAPQGTQAQQDMFETLRRHQKDVEGMQYPRMSEESRRGREEAIRRQEERLGREFDPERQRLAFLRDFLLGGAGRTGIGSVFAGAGGAGARSMAAAEAAQREREDKIESMREALRGKTEEEARQEFSAKLKTREMAMGAEKALLDLSVKMAEGDKDRGTKLAIVAQELATKADLTREELRTRIQLEAQKLGVTLDIADADRLVKMAQVYATREEAAARMRQAEAQQASTEEARRESRVATNVRSRIDDLARIDRDFADMRKNNPMLDQLLTKYEAGEALKPEQAAKVNSYLRAKQERINQVNQAYRSIGVGAGPNVGAVGGTNLVDLAKAELARRESAK